MNAQKAADNLDKHHVRFEIACEVFLDPLSRLVHAGVKDEARDGRLFFVVHVVRAGDVTRIISARRASRAEQLNMKSMSERLKTRMRKDRPWTTMSIRIPDDVVADLEEIAPMLGVSSSEALARSYIGRGLRTDLDKLEGTHAQMLTDSLLKHGIADDVISAAIEDAGLKTA